MAEPYDKPLGSDRPASAPSAAAPAAPARSLESAGKNDTITKMDGTVMPLSSYMAQRSSSTAMSKPSTPSAPRPYAAPLGGSPQPRAPAFTVEQPAYGRSQNDWKPNSNGQRVYTGSGDITQLAQRPTAAPPTPMAPTVAPRTAAPRTPSAPQMNFNDVMSSVPPSNMKIEDARTEMVGVPQGSVKPEVEEEAPAVMGIAQSISESVGAFVGNTPVVRGVRAMFHSEPVGEHSDIPGYGTMQTAANSAFATPEARPNYAQGMSLGSSQRYALNPSIFGEDPNKRVASTGFNSPLGS